MYYRTVVNVNARRAALNNATGRMWPVGRSLPTPGLKSHDSTDLPRLHMHKYFFKHSLFDVFWHFVHAHMLLQNSFQDEDI